MTLEEIKIVMEEALKNSSGMTNSQIIFLIVIAGLSSFFGAYLKEKAKSSVTKEDIEEITHKIESIKQEIKTIDRISNIKYQHKYNACLKMLSIIDAQLSHIMATDNNKTDKQFTTSEDLRKCHNDLLLSVDNPEVIKVFLNIMFKTSERPMEDLNEIRGLVRSELGFGKEIKFDTEIIWTANVICKKMAKK